MDQHGVNSMGMQPISMPMGMSMAMAMPNSVPSGVAQPMGMPMNPMAAGMNPQYGVAPQQSMMMGNVMGGMNGMNGMGVNPMMKMPMGAMNPAMQPGVGVGVPPAPTAQPPVAGADWRIQVTREHRANLIAKIYNELVRVSSEPPPGIKLWMNVAWYELQLYKESRTQEDYISKIFNRLKTLRAQQPDMNAAMNAQSLPNNGILSRLDFSYYNNMNPRAAGQGMPGQPGYPGAQPFAAHGGVPGAQPGKPMVGGGPAMQNPAAPGAIKDSNTPRNSMSMGMPGDAGAAAMKPDGGLNSVADNASEYWRQHAALKTKYHEDVEKVHSAFKKYVDHMKDQNETDQKKKLRYLLSYVQLCASVLSEDITTHQPRKLEELDKVYKYIVKIVNPYLKKLRTETDKRTFPGQGPQAGAPGIPSGIAPGNSVPNPPGGPIGGATNGMPQPGQMQQGMNAKQQQQQQQQRAQQQAMQNQRQNSNQQSQQGQQQSAQQSQQQQYQQQLQQQRQQQLQQQQQQQQQQQPQNQQQLQLQQQQQQQQLQQQQRMQYARQQQQQQQHQQQQQQQQQQMQLQRQKQQQQMMQQTQQTHHQQQQKPASGQGNQQQPGKPTQSSPGQQTPQRNQAPTSQGQQQQQQLRQQQPPSRGNNSPTLGSGLGLSLDDTSLYSGMDSSLLQMSGGLGSASGQGSFSMSFGSDLSPTTFSSSMDFGLDIDSALSYDGQDGSNVSGQGGPGGDGDGSDLMNFVEQL